MHWKAVVQVVAPNTALKAKRGVRSNEASFG